MTKITRKNTKHPCCSSKVLGTGNLATIDYGETLVIKTEDGSLCVIHSEGIWNSGDILLAEHRVNPVKEVRIETT